MRLKPKEQETRKSTTLQCEIFTEEIKFVGGSYCGCSKSIHLRNNCIDGMSVYFL